MKVVLHVIITEIAQVIVRLIRNSIVPILTRTFYLVIVPNLAKITNLRLLNILVDLDSSVTSLDGLVLIIVEDDLTEVARTSVNHKVIDTGLLTTLDRDEMVTSAECAHGLTKTLLLLLDSVPAAQILIGELARGLGLSIANRATSGNALIDSRIQRLKVNCLVPKGEGRDAARNVATNKRRHNLIGIGKRGANSAALAHMTIGLKAKRLAVKYARLIKFSNHDINLRVIDNSEILVIQVHILSSFVFYIIAQKIGSSKA